MKRTNLFTRILLIGLCFLSSHVMALAQGQGKEPVRISTQEELLDVLSSPLRAGEEIMDIFIEKDLLVDTVVVVRNTTPIRIHGNAFIRDKGFSESIFVLEYGTNLTLESDINGANEVSNAPEIVVREGATFCLNGSNITNVTHSKALMGIIENAGTMRMTGGKFGEYKSLEVKFDVIPYCCLNTGTLTLMGGNIDGTVSNRGKMIINQNASQSFNVKNILCGDTPLEIVSPLHTNLSLSKGNPLLINSGFKNGETVAQGGSNYQLTESDREHLVFRGTNIVTELSGNQIRIKSGGSGIIIVQFDLQALIDQATGTAQSPTLITVPEEGISLSKTVTIKDKHVKITGGKITADFSETKWLKMFVVESGSLTLEDITLDGNRGEKLTTPAEETCTFIHQKGGVCHLNNGVRMTNAFGHWDYLNALILQKGTTYVHDGCFISDNLCLLGGCVYVDKEAILVMDGGMIFGNNPIQGEYWYGGVYVAGQLDFYGGEISHHMDSNISIAGVVNYGSAATNKNIFSESMMFHKGGVLNMNRPLTYNVTLTFDEKVQPGDVLVRANGYQLTESDLGHFKLPEGYSLEQRDNTFILAKTGASGISTFEELIDAIDKAPVGTLTAPTVLTIVEAIPVTQTVVIKNKHIKLVGDNLTFNNGATGHIRFFNLEGAASLTIKKATLNGAVAGSNHYCSFFHVSNHSTLNLSWVTMTGAHSNIENWALLTVLGTCNAEFTSFHNNTGNGLIYIGSSATCHFNGAEMNIASNNCIVGNTVYPLIYNYGVLNYNGGSLTNNVAVPFVNYGEMNLGKGLMVANPLRNYNIDNAALVYGSLTIDGSNFQDDIYLGKGTGKGCVTIYEMFSNNQLDLVCPDAEDGWVAFKGGKGYKLTEADLRRIVLANDLSKEYMLALEDNTFVLRALAGQKYNVTVGSCLNGTLKSDKSQAAKGELVTITATPAAGYKLYADQLCYNRYYQLQATADKNVFTFNMPSTNAHVEAEFIPEKSNITPPDTTLFTPDDGVSPAPGIGNLDSLIIILGGDPDLEIDAKPVDENDLPGEMRDAIDRETTKGSELIGSLEELISRLDSKGNVETLYTIPSGKVRLTFFIKSSNLRAAGGQYYILCYSQGEVSTIIPEYDPESRTVTFETDRMGIFSVLYGQPATANERITDGKAPIRVVTNGDRIEIHNLPAGIPYQIFDFSGRMVYGGIGNGGILSWTPATKGAYIIYIEGKSYKISF